MYSIINKKAEVEGKSKKIFKLDDNTYFMVFKPHLRSITSKREEKTVIRQNFIKGGYDIHTEVKKLEKLLCN